MRDLRQPAGVLRGKPGRTQRRLIGDLRYVRGGVGAVTRQEGEPRLPPSSVRHGLMDVVGVDASDYVRISCTLFLRRANPSKRARLSSESQRRRSKCPHSGHRRTHSPSSSTASRYWNSSSPPQPQLSRTGVSSCLTGLAWTGCSVSPAVRSIDSKADRTRPARRRVSGSPVIRVRSVRCRATAS